MTKKNFKVLILTCWALLLICLVIKLFGGNWFELNSENTKFIQFCEFIDNNLWFKMILYSIIAVTTTYPVICIMHDKKKLTLKQTIIYSILLIIKSIINWYITWIIYLFDLIIMILLPLLFNKFKNWKRVIFVNILIVLLQFLCLIIRNLSFDFVFANSILEQLLIQIDYFIMVVLCYLYNSYFIAKKEGK